MRKQFVLITGLSGSGKTVALHIFEDLNFFCVDNLPSLLLPSLIDFCSKKEIKQVAVVMDVRGGDFSEQLSSTTELIKKENFLFEILFLEAYDDILVRRYSETRRKHPLLPSGGILEGIQQEKKMLAQVREMAHKILDTSTYSPRRLREELTSLYTLPENGKPLKISIFSFGYKYGLPLDADLVFDVRFLPNPYYREELHNLTGNDPPVKKFVLSQPETQQFLNYILPFLEFALPHYEKDGKRHLKLAIGCTGGRHRSIAIANEIYDFLSKKEYPLILQHRDMEK
ncbi:MAG: RNase adapter RapZ [Candidatus Eremiobacteraeota bacterium]|jgi:UPF0042 nucleotide-binding protein|nr:RNase adapter RapZ [Candidatus Eremiobacteraeota bacterium]MCL5055671.1 RNase adapter RapZ [Bacillota bacterium]